MSRRSSEFSGGLLPEFLADRDLGKTVVIALRSAGVVVHTLAEVFGGEQGAQETSDVDWIEVAGRHGWAALTKNKRIRYTHAGARRGCAT
jgi:PIN like domain